MVLCAVLKTCQKVLILVKDCAVLLKQVTYTLGVVGVATGGWVS